MEPDYNFWVYIITNRTDTVLYIGMTNDLARRTGEHREGNWCRFSDRLSMQETHLL